MVSFPNCKLNLGLNIIGKRDDGFHNIETVFLPLPIQDALEIIAAGNINPVEFSHSGLPIAGDEKDNLCIKAYLVLKRDFPQLPPVKLHLHKAIPIGAGLGGGSADGAFTLLLLNKKFSLGLSEQQLISYALQLGSDCPFFIINKPCFAEHRGEKLTPVALNLSGCTIVLVNPGMHVNTGWAFSQIKPGVPAISIKDIMQQPPDTWKNTLVNDFEEAVTSHHPELRLIKELLYKMGAFYASMSGSGSSFYGLFKAPHRINGSIFPESYFVKTVSL